MKIVWQYDEITSLMCYEYTLKDIKRGFFQRNRFYLLPYLPTKFRDRVVFYPPKEDLERVIKKYSQQFKRKLLKLESETTRVSPLFSEYCYKYISKKDYEIIIKPTYIGSIGRYDFKDKNQITLYPRFDRNIFEIFCLIITAIIEFEYPEIKSDKQWRKKQKLTETIFKSQEFRRLFPKVKDMTEILKENSTGNLAVESSEYLKELGYPIKAIITNLNSIKGLTTDEKEVLSIFLKSRSKIINYDDIAKAMWGDKNEDKYSLFAISKLMERVRRKLLNSGTQINLIESQRGVGYVLYD